MKTTITVNIKNQLNDAHALGFESGFEAGILRAVAILKQTMSDSAESDSEVSNSDNIDEVIEILESEPITRSPHKKHKWKLWLKPFTKALLTSQFTKDELIELGSEQNLSEDAVNTQAWKLGFSCKKGDEYYLKTHSQHTYKLQQLVQEVELEIENETSNS